MISTAHPQGYPGDIHIFSRWDGGNRYAPRFLPLPRFIRDLGLTHHIEPFATLIHGSFKISISEN